MKGILLLNGEPFSGEIDTLGKLVCCCDGAYNWAKEKGIRIDICIGDFDSLGFKPEGAEVFPVEKDFTDAELGFERLVASGADEIEIYGGSGKREDHFFGNVGLLIRAHKRGVKAVFRSDYTDFFIVEGLVEIREKIGTTVSVVPISESLHINSNVGFKYGACDLTIKQGESIGLSNEVTKEKACMDIDEGRGILFIVRKK